MVLRGIVAGGEIDGAVELAALNFVSDGGSGSESVAEERANSVRMENGDGQRGEFFGVETGIVSDENGGFGGFGFDVLGDRGDREAHVSESEIVSDQPAPAGCAELDGRRCDAWRGAHDSGSVALSGFCAKRERARW